MVALYSKPLRGTSRSATAPIDFAAFVFVEKSGVELLENVDTEREELPAETILRHIAPDSMTLTDAALAQGLALATLAAQGGFTVAGAGVAMSCVPITAPFSTPPVAYNLWRPNKRAVAFQRSLMYLSVAQGGLAMFKFFSGNLVGGFFDAMIAGVGIYSASPEGVTMLPTYLTFAGFNGGMDLLQLIQMYQGVMPIYMLPFQYPAWRPMLLLLGCYLTWEFHKELSAVYRGFDSAGRKDTLFVEFMGSELWGCPPGCQEHEAALIEARSGGAAGLYSQAATTPRNQNWGSGTTGAPAQPPPLAPSQPQNFTAFGGTGRTLGGED